MALLYTDEEGAAVCVHELYPEENIYEEKYTLLWCMVKFEGAEEELMQIEQKLLASIEKLDADYAGWRIYDGWAEFYFYAESAKGFENAISAALKPQYRFESGSRKDKKYETYAKLLVPTAQEFQNMQTELIITELSEEGEILELEHVIEHYAVFVAKAQRERFVQEMEERGFTFQANFDDKENVDDFTYGVVMVKKSPIDYDTLVEQTRQMVEMAQKEHGRYDGWGTTSLQLKEEAEDEEE